LVRKYSGVTVSARVSYRGRSAAALCKVACDTHCTAIAVVERRQRSSVVLGRQTHRTKSGEQSNCTTARQTLAQP
jgi:hypothetical protein